MLSRASKFVVWAVELSLTWIACILGLCLSGPAWWSLLRNTPKSFKRHFPFPAVRKAVISVVIPCYKEKTAIRAALRRIDEACVERESVEIIVADAGSPDGTASEAKRTATRCAKRVLSSAPGRAQAHNAGAAAAKGDIIFFLHADTVVPLGWDKLIRDCLRDPTVVMGAFSFGVNRASFDPKNRWGGAPTGMGTVEAFANFRAHRFQLPYGDQGLFLLRARWQQLGPMPEVVVMEDFEFLKRVRTQAVAEGRRIAVLPQAALCSGRRWEKHGVPFCTFANQWFVFAYTALGFSDRQIYEMYYGEPAPIAKPVDREALEASSPSAPTGLRKTSAIGPERLPSSLHAPSPRSPAAPSRSPVAPAGLPQSFLAAAAAAAATPATGAAGGGAASRASTHEPAAHVVVGAMAREPSTAEVADARRATTGAADGKKRAARAAAEPAARAGSSPEDRSAAQVIGGAEPTGDGDAPEPLTEHMHSLGQDVSDVEPEHHAEHTADGDASPAAEGDTAAPDEDVGLPEAPTGPEVTETAEAEVPLPASDAEATVPHDDGPGEAEALAAAEPASPPEASEAAADRAETEEVGDGASPGAAKEPVVSAAVAARQAGGGGARASTGKRRGRGRGRLRLGRDVA